MQIDRGSSALERRGVFDKIRGIAAATSRRLTRHDQSVSARSLDEEYVRGRWEYLKSLPEMGRYAVISGYCAAKGVPVSVLDLGCGTGVLRRSLHADLLCDYVGVDLSPVAVERARIELHGVGRFVAEDILAYEPDKAFDMIILNEVLYYLRDPVDLVRRYAGALEKDGAFIVSLWKSRASVVAWRHVAHALEVIDAVDIRNKDGVGWSVRLCRPIG